MTKNLTDIQKAVLHDFISNCENMGFGYKKELRINSIKIVVSRDSENNNIDDATADFFNIHTYKNEVVVDDLLNVHISDLENEINIIAAEARKFQLVS